MTGGCGRWTGFGHDQMRIEAHELAVEAAPRPRVQIAFIACTRSRSSFQRVRKAVPWCSISSAFQPAADAEQHAPAGEMVERRHLLRGRDRIALDQQADAGADLDARRHRRRHGERDEQVVGVRVLLRQNGTAGPGAAPRGRDVRVLGKPERFEPARLRLARELVGADGVVGGEHLHAEEHAARATLPAGTRQGDRARQAAARPRAVRSATAMMVRLGFQPPPVGNTLPSQQYRLSTSWNRPSGRVTDVAGSLTHAQRAQHVPRRGRAAELKVARRGEDARSVPGVADDLLHHRQVEAPRLELEAMVRVGDARHGQPEHVAHGRVERDVVRAQRRVLALHEEPEQMLADRLVAQRVLERLAEGEAAGSWKAYTSPSSVIGEALRAPRTRTRRPGRRAAPSGVSTTRISAPPGSTPRKSDSPLVTAWPRWPCTRRGKKPFTLVWKWNIRFCPTCPLALPSASPAGRGREQAEPRRLDGRRGQHVGVGGGRLQRARRRRRTRRPSRARRRCRSRVTWQL